ncbi:hypothetical protein [Anaeroselena agilis]|uniref:Glucuronate isomerase n=1 Tax=Anaeroselena agilis TaxID=3063788 RepID=A0ABU3NST0_9FIRM|nr:hypothetical protein [Selenomonadales bacterium 4137-cl]
MTMITKESLPQAVEKALAAAPVTDLHTHIFAAGFGDLLLWGVDELVTYHYLIAENFRYTGMPYEQYFTLGKKEQADLIWRNLFIEHSPVSEAQRGVLTALAKLGLDVGSRNLASFREFCSSFTPGEYIDKVFATSGVSTVVMTNDPFNAKERAVWLGGGCDDRRFQAALRLDPLLNAYDQTYLSLREWGYPVDKRLDRTSVEEIKRFLREWAQRMKALYMAVSLPPTFAVPEDSLRSRLIEECVLPVARELDIPFAMMIGVNKLVNHKLGDAGDSVGKSSVRPLEYLCEKYPDNKFLVTMLARENQHELAVTARKFRNLLVFGCWWFLNNPSLVEEMTRMRMELLGLSFVPQHSDARILDQLIYKWDHSRKIIGKVLVDKYGDLLATGWRLDEAELKRDAEGLLGGNFWQFIGKEPMM